MGEHIELANLASYLVSDESGYMNGEVGTIPGGEWGLGAGVMIELEKMPKAAWKLLQMKRKKKK